MYKLNVKKVHNDAVIPSFAHPGDAGMDLFSVADMVINPTESALIPTGICIELPKDTEAQVRPRSGLALNYSVTVLNSPGTIDEGYRGEIKVILINHGKEPFIVEKGDKIAQMVIKPTYKVEIIQAQELGDSSRGEGGFGSTGRR